MVLDLDVCYAINYDIDQTTPVLKRSHIIPKIISLLVLCHPWQIDQGFFFTSNHLNQFSRFNWGLTIPVVLYVYVGYSIFSVAVWFVMKAFPAHHLECDDHCREAFRYGGISYDGRCHCYLGAIDFTQPQFFRYSGCSLNLSSMKVGHHRFFEEAYGIPYGRYYYCWLSFMQQIFFFFFLWHSQPDAKIIV